MIENDSILQRIQQLQSIRQRQINEAAANYAREQEAARLRAEHVAAIKEIAPRFLGWVVFHQVRHDLSYPVTEAYQIPRLFRSGTVTRHGQRHHPAWLLAKRSFGYMDRYDAVCSYERSIHVGQDGDLLYENTPNPSDDALGQFTITDVHDRIAKICDTKGISWEDQPS